MEVKKSTAYKVGYALGHLAVILVVSWILSSLIALAFKLVS